MDYKEGDIVRVVLYKQPEINIHNNRSVIMYCEKDLETITNGLVVKKIHEDEYIVAYVSDGKLVQQVMKL